MVRLVFISWLLRCGVASANAPRNLPARLTARVWVAGNLQT